LKDAFTEDPPSPAVQGQESNIEERSQSEDGPREAGMNKGQLIIIREERT
jgi:hypothetical protein